MLLRAFVALLLLLSLAPPAGTAQGPGAPVTLLEDGLGDVRSEVSGTAGPPASALYPGADLLALSVVESAPSFTFRLAMAALPSATDPGQDGVNYEILFSHNGREFEVKIWRVLEGIKQVSPQPPFATLSYRDSPEDAWSGLWFSTSAPLFDETAKSVTIDIPRLDLVDADGASPFPGRSLEGIRVHAHGSLEDAQVVSGSGIPVITQPQRFIDDMPDDPSAAASLPVTIGPRQSGHARLTSDQPFRSSNGEATTILYSVKAHNLGDAADRFELSASSVPRGYGLTLPVPVVDIPGKSTVEVPVLLTMPFGHQHGAAASFLLQMASLSDPGSVGRIELGVRYLEIPQPAGHHDTVYLHKAPNVGGLGPAFGFRSGYINTLEDDPADTKEDFHTSYLSISDLGRFESRWPFPLSPTLSMGIDVDPAKTGHVKIPIGTTQPLRETTVEALLLMAPSGDYPQDGVVLARMAPTAPRDIAPNSEALIEGEMVPEPGAGRVPFERGQNLWLEVIVTSSSSMWSAATEGAYIAPGGSARLPLREWHDPVDDVLSALGGPGLSPLGPQERLVNPGKAVVFPVSIANPLDSDARLEFEVTGPNAEWATLSEASLTAPAHGVAKASVNVRVPPGAADGDRADLVLQAYLRDDPTSRGLLRLVAEVDTDADHADDTALASVTATKESPAPGILPSLLLGLALLGWVRRGGRPGPG